MGCWWKWECVNCGGSTVGEALPASRCHVCGSEMGFRPKCVNCETGHNGLGGKPGANCPSCGHGVAVPNPPKAVRVAKRPRGVPAVVPVAAPVPAPAAPAPVALSPGRGTSSPGIFRPMHGLLVFGLIAVLCVGIGYKWLGSFFIDAILPPVGAFLLGVLLLVCRQALGRLAWTVSGLGVFVGLVAGLLALRPDLPPQDVSSLHWTSMLGSLAGGHCLVQLFIARMVLQHDMRLIFPWPLASCLTLVAVLSKIHDTSPGDDGNVLIWTAVAVCIYDFLLAGPLHGLATRCFMAKPWVMCVLYFCSIWAISAFVASLG